MHCEKKNGRPVNIEFLLKFKKTATDTFNFRKARMGRCVASELRYSKQGST